MRKLPLAIAVLAMSATSAFSADLAARPYTKAPPMVAAIYDWSGFYIGINGGGGSAAGNFGNGGSIGLLTTGGINVTTATANQVVQGPAGNLTVALADANSGNGTVAFFNGGFDVSGGAGCPVGGGCNGSITIQTLDGNLIVNTVVKQVTGDVPSNAIFAATQPTTTTNNNDTSTDTGSGTTGTKDKKAGSCKP